MNYKNIFFIFSCVIFIGRMSLVSAMNLSEISKLAKTALTMTSEQRAQMGQALLEVMTAEDKANAIIMANSLSNMSKKQQAEMRQQIINYPHSLLTEKQARTLDIGLFFGACSQGRIDDVVAFIEQGIDVNSVDLNRRSPLHFACSKKGNIAIVEHLINCGAKINAVDSAQATPLMAACECGDCAIVKFLIEKGADVNHTNDTEHTALHIAAYEGHVGTVSLLLQYVDNIDVRDKELITPLHMACQKGHHFVVDLLIRKKAQLDVQDSRGHTSLHVACKYIKVMELLLKNGANPEVKSSTQETPLHYACSDGNVQVVDLLLHYKADLYAESELKSTPFHYVCYFGHIDLLKNLINKNKNISVSNEHGLTLLHSACQGGHLNVVKLLLQNKVDIEAKDTIQKLAPIFYAIQAGDVDIVEYLIKAGADKNVKSTSGSTLLMSACQSGHLKIVEFLLKNGACVRAKDNTQATALHFAVLFGHNAIAEQLLNAKADIDAQTTNGATPFHIACLEGNLDIVKMLIRYDAAIDVYMHGKFSPIEIAHHYGNHDIVTFIGNRLLAIKKAFDQQKASKELIEAEEKEKKLRQQAYGKKRSKKNQKTDIKNSLNQNTIAKKQPDVMSKQQQVFDSKTPVNNSNKNNSVITYKEYQCLVDHNSVRGGYDNTIIIFKHHKPGNYYQEIDQADLTLAPKIVSNVGDQLKENHLLVLMYSKHVQDKMHNIIDVFHSFATHIEQKFGNWACTIIKDFNLNFNKKKHLQEQFDITEDISDYWYQLHVEIPGRITFFECSDHIIKKQGPAGVFKFIILKKDLSDSHGLCVHRFFERYKK